MKVEIRTNDDTLGDWMTIHIDGKPYHEGHDFSLYDFREFLSFIGAEHTQVDNAKFEDGEE